MKSEIISVKAREILDSRANPTVECEVTLADGTCAVASVPSGASTGAHEAHELRDGDASRYGGRGVLSAVSNVTDVIAPALLGYSALDGRAVDRTMIELDGTKNKSRLGANAILAVSLATARAAAKSVGLPLFRYLGGALPDRIPVPMMNVLNGGAHAGNNADIQEFMILPLGFRNYTEALAAGSEIYHALKTVLANRGLSTGIGDEGGFAPDLDEDAEALSLLEEATRLAGYAPGTDVRFAVDVAASEWASDDGYRLKKRGIRMSADELVRYYTGLCDRFPLVSVEDGMGEEDTEGWKKLTEALGGRMLLVGDDLFVTNEGRLAEGIRSGIANAILIKPNQIGTLTECADCVALAKSNGYRVILSHRSGETTDTFLSDLSVALGADFIKAGAPARGERVAKYDRLLRIGEMIGKPKYGALCFDA